MQEQKISLTFTSLLYFLQMQIRKRRHTGVETQLLVDLVYDGRWSYAAFKRGASGFIKPGSNFYAKQFPSWKTEIFDLVSVLSWHWWAFLTSTRLVKHFLLWLPHLWDSDGIYPFCKVAGLSHLLSLRHFWRNSCYVAMSLDHVIQYFEDDESVRQLKKWKNISACKEPHPTA